TVAEPDLATRGEAGALHVLFDRGVQPLAVLPVPQRDGRRVGRFDRLLALGPIDQLLRRGDEVLPQCDELLAHAFRQTLGGREPIDGPADAAQRKRLVRRDVTYRLGHGPDIIQIEGWSLVRDAERLTSP